MTKSRDEKSVLDFDSRRVRRYGKYNPWDPSSYSTAPDFDIVDELVFRRQQYMAESKDEEEWLSVRSFPEVLYSGMEKIAARVAELAKTEGPRHSHRRPGMGVVMTACLTHAVDVLEAHAQVQKVSQARTAFLLRDFEDSDAEDMVQMFFKTFPLEIGLDSGTQRGEDRTWAIPKGIGARVGELASDLCLHKSGVAVLGAALALSTQPSIHKTKRNSLDAALDKFFRKLHWRQEGALALMGLWK